LLKKKSNEGFKEIVHPFVKTDLSKGQLQMVDALVNDIIIADEAGDLGQLLL
jgi:hypothetical protein